VEFVPEKFTGALMSVSSHYFAKLKEEGEKYEPRNPPPAKDAPSPFAKEIKVEGIDGALADFALRQVQCGRVNTLGEDFPYSSPLNYGYANGKILFHSAKTSLKMKNIEKNKNISFDVDWFWDGKQWVSVTVIGQARFLPPEEMILGMQIIAVFMNTPDGIIPKDFKPDPNHKIIGHSGKAVGGEGLSKRLAMVELTPQRIIGRVLPITKGLRDRLPAELIAPKK
jgi:nitroimidazol reductase NimA-like FMN-containing flavoprotein (pyridoxamine 5'-phosphate oxidase superfamily)